MSTPPPAAKTSAGGASMLPATHEQTRNDLSRADITALGCVAALIALLQAITQISSMPRVVYPYLVVAAVLAVGVVGAAIWTLWPRRIYAAPKLPGSWLHARRFDSDEELVAAYDEHAPELISAGQVLALAPVAYRKWFTIRVVLPLFAATVLTLLVALIVGLSAQ